jgi:hypothetical protein
MDLESRLRSHRKALVIAAEAAVTQASTAIPEFRDKSQLKSQLNRLIAICGEATCAEEITSYLRYQTARKAWPSGFADAVIAKVQEPLEALSRALPATADADRDRAYVAAWRLYAVFLARAFTYLASSGGSKKGQSHDRASR